jgi:amino acid transporter
MVSLVPPSTHAHLPMAFYTATNDFQIEVLYNVITAMMLVFVVSAANSGLYIASRTLYSLALLGHAPRIFRKVTKRGVPIWAVLVSWLCTMLGFMTLAEESLSCTSPRKFTLS